MKKIFIGIGVMAALVILGLGMYQSNAASKVSLLSKNEITDLVSSQYPGEITKIEMTEDANKSIYDVTIKGEKAEYALQMDAASGEVLKLKETQVLTVKENTNKNNHHKKDSNKKGQKTEKNKQQSAKKTEENQQNSKPVKKESNKNQHNKEGSKNSTQSASNDNNAKQHSKQEKPKKRTIISKEQAIQIALKQFSGTVDDVDLEDDDGRLHYEIEIEQGDREANIEIDAYTGEVLIMEIDD